MSIKPTPEGNKTLAQAVKRHLVNKPPLKPMESPPKVDRSVFPDYIYLPFNNWFERVAENTTGYARIPRVEAIDGNTSFGYLPIEGTVLVRVCYGEGANRTVKTTGDWFPSLKALKAQIRYEYGESLTQAAERAIRYAEEYDHLRAVLNCLLFGQRRD